MHAGDPKATTVAIAPSTSALGMNLRMYRQNGGIDDESPLRHTLQYIHALDMVRSRTKQRFPVIIRYTHNLCDQSPRRCTTYFLRGTSTGPADLHSCQTTVARFPFLGEGLPKALDDVPALFVLGKPPRPDCYFINFTPCTHLQKCCSTQLNGL